MRYYNNLLIDYFGIKEARNFKIQKIYEQMLWACIEFYVKICIVYLFLKELEHGPYFKLQFFFVLRS